MSLTLLFSIRCLAQETEATPVDAQSRLTRALDKSAERGGMKVEGAVAPAPAPRAPRRPRPGPARGRAQALCHTRSWEEAAPE